VWRWVRNVSNVLTTILTLITLSAAPVEPFNRGNALYQQGDYAGAAAAYQQALLTGPNPDALYNLGNAQFKSNQTGRAIASYQRARFLRPRDRDIAANLVFAQSYRADKNLTLPGPFETLIDRSFHRLSSKEATLLAAISFLLLALLVSLFIAYRRRWPLYAAIPAFLLFGFGAMTDGSWHGYVKSRPAVIVVPEVSALSGPGEDYKQILLVHDGSEAKVREIRGAWLLLQLPGGAGGWVKRDAVELIFP
jgi:tetratricopeptide (TPR) repeat protein